MARVEPSEPRESDLRMNAWLLPLQQEICSMRREKETLRSEKETLRSEKETLRSEKETLRKENETLQQRKLQLLKQRSQLLQQKNKNNEPICLELIELKNGVTGIVSRGAGSSVGKVPKLRRRFSVRGSRSDGVYWRGDVLVSHPKETAD
jgi:predicted RNase H-like nuclease (RuvC/YqgF family)